MVKLCEKFLSQTCFALQTCPLRENFAIPHVLETAQIQRPFPIISVTAASMFTLDTLNLSALVLLVDFSEL